MTTTNNESSEIYFEQRTRDKGRIDLLISRPSPTHVPALWFHPGASFGQIRKADVMRTVAPHVAYLVAGFEPILTINRRSYTSAAVVSNPLVLSASFCPTSRPPADLGHGDVALTHLRER